MSDEFPLHYRTPIEWGAHALQDIPALLSDHAYLERKAASNALELLNRWPEPNRPAAWVTTLAGIARDEAFHLDLVTKMLKKKGGKLERQHRSLYAGDLRRLVRMGLTPQEVLDRLLVSSLIEARSCERFEILAATAKDDDLARLYAGLCESERGHHKHFLDLAADVVPADELEKRWVEMKNAEAFIIQKQPPHGLHGFLVSKN